MPKGRLFKTILAAVDPVDDLAPAVLRAAEGVAKAHSARLTVVSVTNSAIVTSPGAEPMAFAAYEAAVQSKEDVRNIEYRLRELVAQEAPSAKCETITGGAANAVLKCADDLDVDLIVIGTHQKGFWESLVLGSMSADVSHRSKAAVLMVPPSFEAG